MSTRIRASLLALTALVGLASPAWAIDVRPQGYLERGTLQQSDEGMVFVPDLERNQHGGRYFRLSGSDLGVFYGLGSYPSVDWIWPSHHTYPALRDIMEASAGGLIALSKYEDGAEYTEGVSRAFWLVAVAGVAGALGGLVYDLIPNNTREMQPVWFVGSGATALVGLAVYGFSQSLASQNEALLDQAIDAYNRDMAGKRMRTQYMAPLPGSMPQPGMSPLPGQSGGVDDRLHGGPGFPVTPAP